MSPRPPRSLHPLHRAVSALLAALMTCFTVTPAFALPEGGQVRHGEVSFDRQGGDLIIRQNSPRAIVNYDSFSIGGAESVRFEQPGAGSAILNRVTGGSSSSIAGAMLANGHVYLINPNGILFSSSARVDVGGLVASAMNLSDENFLAGRMAFSGGGGSVVNQGSITAGRVALVGGRVENDGVIRAGNILLGAGRESVVIDEVEGGQIRLIIDGQADASPAAPTVSGSETPAAGAADSETPAVAQQPAEQAAGELAGNPVPDASGEPVPVMPEAQPTPGPALSLADQIRQDAQARALVYNKGTLDASGVEGGQVALAGELVVQDGVIRADGSAGRGGSVNLTAKDLVLVTTASQTSADAGEAGQGGSIIVLSPGTAIYEAGAQASARGGRTQGDGGFAEISGHAQVVVSGVVDLGADHGDAGTLLIDPFNVLLNNVGPQSGGSFNAAGTWVASATPSVILVANLLAQLSLTDVIVSTAGAGAEAGNITLASVLALGATPAGRTLTFNGHNNIDIIAAITAGANPVNVLLNADIDAVGGGTVTVAANVGTGGGNFQATGAGFTQSAGVDMATAGGSFAVNVTGAALLIGSSITTSGGPVVINAGNASTIASAVTTSGGNITAIVNGAGQNLTASGGLNASGGAGTGAVDIRSNSGALNLSASALLTSGGAGSVTIRSAGLMTLDGDVTSNGADVDIDVTGIANVNINGTAHLNAQGGANAGTIDIMAANGNLTLAAASQVRSGSAGTVQLTANAALNDLSLAGTVEAGTGGLVASARRTLTHSGTTTSGGPIQMGGDMDFDGVGDGTYGGSISSSGSLSLRGANAFITGVVDSNGGNISIIGHNDTTVSGDILTDGGNVQVNASIGGAGNILITATGLVDARLGANTGIVTLSNGGGNITNQGEVRSGTAGRLFAFAGGGTGSFTQSGVFVGGTEALLGTTVRAHNGITVSQTVSGGGAVTLDADFDNNGTGNLVLNAVVIGNGGVTLKAVDITGNNSGNISAQNNPIQATATGLINLPGFFDANGGNITINAGTTLTLGNGGLDSDGGNIALNSGGNMTLGGLIDTDGGTFDAHVIGVGFFQLNDDISTNGGNVDITTANGLLATGNNMDVNAGGGSAVRLESLNGVQDLDIGGLVIGGSGGTVLRAGNHVTIGGAVTSNGGQLTLAADSNNGGVGTLAVTRAVNVTGGADLVLSGRAFTQSASGTLTTNGGAITGDFVDAFTISRAVNSNGGAISFTGDNGITVSATVSSGPPSGGTGTLRLIGNVTLNNTPTVGNADVAFNGGGLDLVINSPINLNGNLELGALRDVIINSPVSTSAGKNLYITADANFAVDAATTRGGVLVQGAGSLDAGNHLVVLGAQLNDALGLGNAIFTLAPGNTLSAGGNLRLSTLAGSPAGAHIRLTGDATAGGSIQVDTNNSLFQDVGADLIANNGGSIRVVTGGQVVQNFTAVLRAIGGGNIFVDAGGDIILEGARANEGGLGNIALRAGGTIFAIGPGVPEVRGDHASLIAIGGGIGVAPGNAFSLNATRVATQSAGNQILISPAGQPLVFNDVAAVPVNSIGLDGSVSGSASSPGLNSSTTTAGGGISAVASGALTVNHALSAGGGLLLSSSGGSVNLNDTVSVSAGGLTLDASSDIDIGAGVAVTAAPGFGARLIAGGALDMGSGSSLVAGGGGNILATIGGVATLGLLSAPAGALSLTAASVVDGNAGANNLRALATRIQTTTGGVGTGAEALETQTATLAVNSAGGVFLSNTGGLAVDTVGQVFTTRVLPNLLTVVDSDVVSLSDVIGGGPVVLSSTGTLTLNDGILANGLAVQSGAGANLRVESTTSHLIVNAAAVSGNHLTLLADDDIFQNVNLAVTAAGATLDALASGNALMLAGTSSSTASGNIRYRAIGGRVDVGTLTAGGGGSVSVVAGTSILGVAPHLITGSSVRLEAGDGVGSQVFLAANQILTQTTTLAAMGGASGVSVADLDAVVIGAVGPLSVNRVDLDGTDSPVTDALLNGVSTSAGGSLFVAANNGTLTVDQAVSANGSGVVGLSSSGAASDVALNAGVSSGTGDVQILAARDLISNSAAVSTGGGGSVFLNAGAGAITMNGTASVANGSGNVLLAAAQNIQLGDVNSASGNVAIRAANGSITDGNGASRNAGGASVAFDAPLGAIGSGGNAIETETALLAANAGGGGLFLENTGAVTVNDTPFLGFTLHSASGFPAVFAVGGMSDLSAFGSAVLVSDGGILIEDGTLGLAGIGVSSATGNILLQDLSGDITLRSALSAPTGAITVRADGALSVEFSQTAFATTLDLAAGDDLTMSSGITVGNGGSNLRLEAGDELVLANVNAGALGNVHAAANNIRMVAAGHLVTANQARFVAGNAVGQLAANLPIETAVNIVAASAGGGGIHFRDVDSVTVGTTGIYGVNRVIADGSTFALLDGPLSGLATTANGSIVQRNSTGTLTLADAVSANGAGNIRLASGGGGNIVQNAAVTSGTGHITVYATGALGLNALISTGGAGTVDVQAAGGAVTQNAGITAGSGNVRVEALAGVLLGSIATTGDVSIRAGLGILDNNAAAVNATANRVRLDALGGPVGSSGNRLETATANLAAHSAIGGVFLDNAGAVQTANIAPVTVNRVGPTGATTPFSDAAALNGLSTAANGPVVLFNAGGVEIAGAGIAADGAGNVLVTESAGNITLNGPVTTVSGAISLLASGNIFQNIALATAGNTIDIEAGGDIEQSAGASTSTAGGNVRYQAGGALTLANIDAGAGNVALAALGGSISEDGDAAVDVAANELRVEGSGAGVPGANPLDTAVNTLAVAVGAGGLNLENAGTLTIGIVNPVAVNRVQADGTTLVHAPGAALAGASATGSDLEIATVDGNLFVNQSVSNTSGDAGDKVFLRAGGADRTLQVNAPVSNTTGDAILRATGNINLFANVDGGGNVALWADDDGNLVGDVNQILGTVQAGSLNVFIAGQNFNQGAAGLLQALNGGVIISVNNNVTLGNLVAGVNAANLAVRANNIYLNTAVNITETAVLRSDAGSILNTSLNPAHVLSAHALGLAAVGDIGQPANHLRVDTDLIASRATNGYIFELNSSQVVTGANLIENPGFYPTAAPDCATGMPLPFTGEAEMISFFTGLVSDGDLVVTTQGDLNELLVDAGGNLTLNIGCNLTVNHIEFGGNGIINVGCDMQVNELIGGGNLDLSVAGFYTGQFADLGGYIHADIGGPMTLDELDAGSADIRTGGDFAVSDADIRGVTRIQAGGRAVGDRLHAGGDLTVITGGDLAYTEVDADRNATLTLGGSAEGRTLDVGQRLVLDARRDLHYDDIRVGGPATVQVGGEAEGDTLDVGGTLDLTSGRDVVYTSLSAGDTELDAGGSVEVDEIDTGSLRMKIRGGLTFDRINASGVNATVGGLVKMATVNAGGQAIFNTGRIQDAGSRVRAGNITLTASGDIGAPGRPINIDTSNIVLLRGNNVYVNNLRGGPTTLNLLQASNHAELGVAGSLEDGNGDDPNVIANSALLRSGGMIGRARDPIDIDIETTLHLSGGREIPGFLWGFFRGDLGQPPIRFADQGLLPPGLAVLNSTISLTTPEIDAILLSAQSYGDDLVGFKFRNSVFGDFYFLHLYLAVSELADDLDLNTIDYILYGRALVTPDPELPPAARNPIYIGGDERN